MDLNDITADLIPSLDPEASVNILADACSQHWLFYAESNAVEPLLTLSRRFLSNHALCPSIVGIATAFMPTQKLGWPGPEPGECFAGYFFMNGIVLKRFLKEELAGLFLWVRPDTAEIWGYPKTLEEYYNLVDKDTINGGAGV